MNPRAAINDLHPFQGCPFGQLGYFSEYITRYLIRSLKISNSIVFLMSGEDGIRTHVPLRTNGFQDRLVMTTSIPLQAIYVYVFFSTNKIISFLHLRVNSFFQISSLFSGLQNTLPHEQIFRGRHLDILVTALDQFHTRLHGLFYDHGIIGHPGLIACLQSGIGFIH